MIHHVSLGTNDLEKAKAFYDAVFPHLGLRFIKKSERILAYGLTEVLFSLERPVDGQAAQPGNGTHVAFHAGHRNTVDACYTAGLANGGSDDGAPGIPAQYDAHYYAAFLRDPDGNKIEFVTFIALWPRGGELQRRCGRKSIGCCGSGSGSTFPAFSAVLANF